MCKLIRKEDTEDHLARSYSDSDRMRYYWPDKEVDDTVADLIKNLSTAPLPLPLISQYLPLQYQRVREGVLYATPHDLIIDHIQNVLRQYRAACQGVLA